MRHNQLILLGCIALAMAGCAKDPLDNVEKAAAKYRDCMAKRTFKDECAVQQEAVETARLVAVKAGSQPSQIDAARTLGMRSVKGGEEESPYAAFLKRRKEVLATNLMRANEEQLREDEALAKTIEELKSNKQPLSQRQKAEMLLVQSMLEEKYPTYFTEPANGIESDPEILNMVCQEGTQANLAQACRRYKKR